MTVLPITALFVGIFALLYFRSSIKTIFARSEAKVWYGEGSDPSAPLARHVRSHAHFIEYVPLLLLVMGLLEFNGLNAGFLYTYGAAILIGRLIYERGMMRHIQKYLIIGTQLTLWPLLFGGGILLYSWFAQTFIF